MATVVGEHWEPRESVREEAAGEATNSCPPDVVERHFEASRPYQLRVDDLTYVATWRGFVYLAFTIDCVSRASTPTSTLARVEV